MFRSYFMIARRNGLISAFEDRRGLKCTPIGNSEPYYYPGILRAMDEVIYPRCFRKLILVQM